MSLDTVPLCPDDCLFDMPIVKFSDCAPQYRKAEISRVYLAKRGQPMVNWADIMEWTSRISETSTADDAIRELVGIGDKPKSEKTETPTSDGRTYISDRTFTLNFIVDDNSDENYDFGRYTGCNPSFLMWYETADGYLYGGNEGIPVSVNAEEPIGNNRKELRKIEFTFKWEAQREPQRMLSVIAAAA